MITRKDLLEAIDKCQGQKNPNANTCIKLAAYYTILDHTPDDSTILRSGEPLSEFIDYVRKGKSDEVWLVLDDLMEELQRVNPKLYYETMSRLKEL